VTAELTLEREIVAKTQTVDTIYPEKSMPADEELKAINEPPGLEARLLLELLADAPLDASSLRNGNLQRLEKLLDRLTRLLLIDKAGRPTHLAREIAPFITGNVGVRLAIALGASGWYNTTWYTIKAVAILAAQHPFFIYPPNNLAGAFAAHASFEIPGSESDLVTLVNAFDRLNEEYSRLGDDAVAFAEKNFLDFETFLEIRALIEALTETAITLGWDVEVTEFTEADLFATFYRGYLDRLERWDEDTGRWQSVDRFLTEMPGDSLHHGTRRGGAELVLCVGLIFKQGRPEGKTAGASFNATTPEAMSILSNRMTCLIESYPSDDGQTEVPYQVWYWGDQRLSTRECPMPEGTPLEVLREMHRRGAKQLPLYEPRNGSCKPLSWADLAKHTRVPDLQTRVAEAWLVHFPDFLPVGQDWLPVQYGEKCTIRVTFTHEQAVRLLPTFSLDPIPQAWSGRSITIEVEDDQGGEPFAYPIEELDILRQLYAGEEAPDQL
jgi:hypothetical protein